MKSNKYLSLLLVLFLSITAFAQNPTDDSTPVAVEIVQVDTIPVMSDIMNREIKCVVVVPEQYSDPESQEVQYPVVYLLNGYSGNYSDYTKRIENLNQLASDYGFIFVCPDGQDSWYFDSPIDKNYQFESFITKELIPFIDDNYRTMSTPKMRGITGLSMGGHGAMWLAMRHPELFSIVGSMSGGVDFRPFAEKWSISKRLGDYASNKASWDSHTVISLVPTLKNGTLKIIFDCGTADFFNGVNENLHKALLAQGIDHDYISRPGNHNWDYWRNALDYQLLFFQKGFEANSDN